MLRRGLPVTVGISVGVAPKEEARQDTVELATSGRVRSEDRRESLTGTGATGAVRAIREVAGFGRQSSGAAVPSSLPQAAVRREVLVGRLRAAEWHGAVSKARGRTGDATAMVVTGGRAVATEEKVRSLAGRGLYGTATLEVSDPRVDGSGLSGERVTGGATAHHELSVRGTGRDAEVAGQGRMTQRRQRRVELEAEEDLRLELVR
jgi:hypothetical protein